MCYAAIFYNMLYFINTTRLEVLKGMGIFWWITYIMYPKITGSIHHSFSLLWYDFCLIKLVNSLLWTDIVFYFNVFFFQAYVDRAVVVYKLYCCIAYLLMFLSLSAKTQYTCILKHTLNDDRIGAAILK